MFWQESEEKEEEIRGSQDVFDVMFRIHGERLKVDHASALAESLSQILPAACFASTGVHRIRMASSGNGWNSPQDNDQEMLLSKRSRLILRIHRDDQETVLGLCQNKLKLHDREIRIGSGKIRHLIPIDTLFSHALISDPAEPETQFLSKANDQLAEIGIRVTKMMCGTSSSFVRDGNPVFTRSLMLAGLKPEESIRLQQRGFEGAQQFGCGLFVPHKGVQAVVDIQE